MQLKYQLPNLGLEQGACGGQALVREGIWNNSGAGKGSLFILTSLFFLMELSPMALRIFRAESTKINGESGNKM